VITVILALHNKAQCTRPAWIRGGAEWGGSRSTSRAGIATHGLTANPLLIAAEGPLSGACLKGSGFSSSDAAGAEIRTSRRGATRRNQPGGGVC